MYLQRYFTQEHIIKKKENSTVSSCLYTVKLQVSKISKCQEEVAK